MYVIKWQVSVYTTHIHTPSPEAKSATRDLMHRRGAV